MIEYEKAKPGCDGPAFFVFLVYIRFKFFINEVNTIILSTVNDISKDDCKKIATKIRLDIFQPASSFKISVFLCGADISQTNRIRYKVAKELSSFRYSFLYDIIYPEDIFDELLYSSRTNDLLTLENLLAESVDVILLIPESPGSFAELGAFANDEKLRSKLVCIVDEKYQKDKSFINQGPLRLVKKANKNALLFIDPENINAEIDILNVVLRKLKRNSEKQNDKITLLQIDNFLLPAIFLLEPVSKATLVNLVSSAIESDVNAYQSTTTALTILTKKRFVELTAVGYKLTIAGENEVLSFQQKASRTKTQSKKVAIDNLRLEILNLKNRKKKLKV